VCRVTGWRRWRRLKMSTMKLARDAKPCRDHRNQVIPDWPTLISRRHRAFYILETLLFISSTRVSISRFDGSQYCLILTSSRELPAPILSHVCGSKSLRCSVWLRHVANPSDTAISWCNASPIASYASFIVSQRKVIF
jgi:hypothetical protein